MPLIQAVTVSNDLQTAYQAKIAAGSIVGDPAQQAALSHLQSMSTELVSYAALMQKRGVLGVLARRKRAEMAPRSLYLWGDVGRGKSMLMDLFFASAPVKCKKRIHFHAFMLDVHARIHRWRQTNDKKDKGRNPIPPIARQLAKESLLLCLDEFQVTDVADAMILGRLFTALLKEGCVVVITSNRAPYQLYQGGLQRDRFLKFVDLVLKRMDVLELTGREDYRLRQLKSLQHVYCTPLGPQADVFIEKAFISLSHGTGQTTSSLDLQGRTLEITTRGDVAFATFSELCARPLGSADYLAIAQEFPTVLLKDIPLLSPEKRNEAKRFVTLIDTLYDHRVKLVCTAAAAPAQLYPEGDGSFEFHRTVSRLMEMQSERYLAESHIV